MRWSDLLLRLRALLHHERAETDLDEELRFHLEMEARKHRDAGMTEPDARNTARAAFGGLDLVGEQCRDARGLTFLENIVRDFRYGIRVLRKTPVFTAVAVLSLAIGIGANTAIFSLLDTILLRMLPVRNPEQLVIARWGGPSRMDIETTWSSGGGDGKGNWRTNVFSWPAFLDIRGHGRALSGVMGFSPLGRVNVAANGQALATGAMVVSGNYFQALGVAPILGRALTEDDDTSGGVPSAVISYRLWDRAFGLDPKAIGKTIHVNGQPCVIVGVTSNQFFGVSAGGFMTIPEIDLTLPIRARERLEGAGRTRTAWFGNDLHWVQIMARLKSPAGEAPARAELSSIIMANLPSEARQALGAAMPEVFLEPGSQGIDSLRTQYRQPLVILMVVVALTLLMACANLAGLLLARAAARRREISLRMAVGAGRGRVIRQLLVEGAVLSALGMLAGLGFAWCGVRALVGLLAGSSVPIPLAVSLDLRILGFTAAVSLVTTILFALAPALRATRVDMASALKEDSSEPGRRRFASGRVLVAIQVGIALVLLSGATLFTRSLANLHALPLGFNPHSLILFDISPGKSGYDETRGNQLYARALEALSQTRGVTGVTASVERLISGYVSNGSVAIDGGRRKSVTAYFNFVGPDFFPVMGMPVFAGRGIERRDLTSATRVAVVDESFARRAFPDQSPLGRRFRWPRQEGPSVEIVGVVKDAKYDRIQYKPESTIYVPYTQTYWGWPQQMTFEVRSAASTADTVAAIRGAMSRIDGMIPITEIKTQEAQIDASLSRERLFASIVSVFSAITLILACVGLYGSVAYTVTRRTRELGVRMALGAGRLAVLRMLLGQVAVTVGAGLALGIPATWALTRVIESQLYGIKPHDPATLATACTGVILISLLAAWLPARRATRIDPVRALRCE
jgi:predicted permease